MPNMWSLYHLLKTCKQGTDKIDGKAYLSSCQNREALSPRNCSSSFTASLSPSFAWSSNSFLLTDNNLCCREDDDPPSHLNHRARTKWTSSEGSWSRSRTCSSRHIQGSNRLSALTFASGSCKACKKNKRHQNSCSSTTEQPCSNQISTILILFKVVKLI
jgi:hypothetical protein